MVKNESQYPVYWVEAWNVATQNWIPVDPLVLNKVGLASRFEPPQADLDNSMSYVVAFEEGNIYFLSAREQILKILQKDMSEM